MTDSNVITWNECRKVTSRLLNENDDSEFKRMIDTDKEIKYYTEIINGEYKVEYREECSCWCAEVRNIIRQDNERREKLRERVKKACKIFSVAAMVVFVGAFLCLVYFAPEIFISSDGSDANFGGVLIFDFGLALWFSKKILEEGKINRKFAVSSILLAVANVYLFSGAGGEFEFNSAMYLFLFLMICFYIDPIASVVISRVGKGKELTDYMVKNDPKYAERLEEAHKRDITESEKLFEQRKAEVAADRKKAPEEIERLKKFKESKEYHILTLWNIEYEYLKGMGYADKFTSLKKLIRDMYLKLPYDAPGETCSNFITRAGEKYIADRRECDNMISDIAGLMCDIISPHS